MPRSYAVLLLLLLLLYLLHYPLLRSAPIATALLFYAPLFYGVHVAQPRRSWRPAFFALMALGLVFDAGLHISQAPHWCYIADASVKFVLIALCGAAILVHVHRERQITFDLVFGACTVYFLIAIEWAIVYSIVELSVPGSFSGLPVDDVSRNSFSELLYYSLVTLTTLGYGDIAPQLWLTRSLAALEAFTGQLFVAITIAYLVGLGITAKTEKQEAK